MKTVIVGDVHGGSSWKLITHRERDADRIIFIGDYFDTYEDISSVEQIHNFKEIVEFKQTSFTNPETEEQHKTEVVLLIGNHDHHYFPEVGDSNTGGYQHRAAISISHELNENREHLQMAYNFDNFLFSHAGVSETWLDINKYEGINQPKEIADFVNELWKYKPKYPFMFNGRESTGDDKCQTPIWIRPRSLMADCQSFKKSMIQIVGHTQQNKIDISGKSTGGRYYFIDTLGTSDEYLIINDGKITTGKI